MAALGRQLQLGLEWCTLCAPRDLILWYVPMVLHKGCVERSPQQRGSAIMQVNVYG
jgi:hypothetical protein